MVLIDQFPFHCAAVNQDESEGEKGCNQKGCRYTCQKSYRNALPGEASTLLSDTHVDHHGCDQTKYQNLDNDVDGEVYQGLGCNQWRPKESVSLITKGY